MPRTLSLEEQYQLEGMIDVSSLEDVLHLIAEICDQKAEHIQSNWQDKHYAREWSVNAREIRKLSNRVSKGCAKYVLR